jgi:hypothetical protein
MLSGLTKLHATFDKNPLEILDWVAIGWRNVHSDLGLSTMLDLALTATTIPSQNVNNLVVPATTGTVGTASVVFISSSARSVYDDMRSDGLIG